LIDNYGLAIDKVMSIVLADEVMAQRLADDRDVIKAEVVHAARHEMVVSLSDFVFRRTGFGTLGNPGRDALVQCGALLAQELSWDDQRTNKEIEQVQCSFRSTSDTRSHAHAGA
jgi:glycerol-3-phosphate dehydrogenase